MGFEGSGNTRGYVVRYRKESNRLRDGSLGTIEPRLGNFCDLGSPIWMAVCQASIALRSFSKASFRASDAAATPSLRGIRHGCPAWIAFGASPAFGHSDEPAMSPVQGTARARPSRQSRAQLAACPDGRIARHLRQIGSLAECGTTPAKVLSQGGQAFRWHAQLGHELRTSLSSSATLSLRTTRPDLAMRVWCRRWGQTQRHASAPTRLRPRLHSVEGSVEGSVDQRVETLGP